MHMFAMKILLTPVSGVEKDQPIKDAFNFYLSQLRIGLEQTFFCSYDKKMENAMANSASTSEKVVEVIYVHYRLHNCCIDEDCAHAINADEIQDNGPESVPSDICETSVEGNSVL